MGRITLFGGLLNVEDSLPNLSSGDPVEDQYESSDAQVEIQEANKEADNDESVLETLSVAADKSSDLIQEHENVVNNPDEYSEQELQSKRIEFEQGVESIAGLLGSTSEAFKNSIGLYSSGLNSIDNVNEYKEGVEGIKYMFKKMKEKIIIFINKIIQWFKKIGLKIYAWFKDYEKKAEELLKEAEDIKNNLKDYEIDKGKELSSSFKMCLTKKITYIDQEQTIDRMVKDYLEIIKLQENRNKKLADSYHEYLIKWYGIEGVGDASIKDVAETHFNKRPEGQRVEGAVREIAADIGLKNRDAIEKIVDLAKDESLNMSLSKVVEALLKMFDVETLNKFNTKNRLNILSSCLEVSNLSGFSKELNVVGIKNGETCWIFQLPMILEYKSDSNEDKISYGRAVLGEKEFKKSKVDSLSTFNRMETKDVIEWVISNLNDIKGSKERIKKIADANYKLLDTNSKMLFRGENVDELPKEKEKLQNVLLKHYKDSYLGLRELTLKLFNGPGQYIRMVSEGIGVLKKKNSNSEDK